MDEKIYKTEKDLMASGAILKEYSQTDFLVVAPAPSIGKVKFSIVKQGTKGKDSGDFYMDIETFRLLCQDLCSSSGLKRLAESAEHQYPDAFKFTSGTDGSKHLNIGGGRKGIRIQIQTNLDGKWDNRMVAVSYESIRSMKFRFELIMGIIPSDRYYKSLADVYWAGDETRSKFYKKSFDEKNDGDYVEKEEDNTAKGTNESSVAAASALSAEIKETAPQKTEEKSSPAAKAKETKDPASADKPGVSVYTVQTLGPVKRKGNTYYCPCKNITDNAEYNLCFTAAYLSNMGDKWSLFQEKAADGVKIRIMGAISNHNIQFINIS